MSISQSNNNIRIRTTPLGSDKYVKINLNQKFDFLEILSLKIGQEQVYKQYCSDYGVIVGRVVVNDGVGVPNAKVSIFIPISDEDKDSPKIRAIYPFENIESVDFNNLKYNLLLESPRQDDICHRSVGSFPEKRRILDCEPWCEVYGKYYKYSTSTNASGDYMIFGVPTGVQIVHMDVDLSDIGYLSQKPYDMVSQGSPETLFDSLNQFKVSPNIAQLPQIKSQNKTINVLPFWGDLEQCQIGVNRVDFDLNYKIIPNAFFVGSIFGDSNKNAVNKTCRPKPDLGLNGQLSTGEGTIQILRTTPNGGVESLDIDGGRVIDEDGTWVVQLPMNLETKITDEFGDLVDSENPQIGIPTKSKYRFKISMNEGGTLGRIRARAKFLVPNYGDYSFDESTPEFITTNGITYPNFAEMEWNGVYTVKQFISRFSNNANFGGKNYTGIKDTANSGNVSPFPWNSMSQDLDFLFIFLCIIANILGAIIFVVNAVISSINTVFEFIADICIGNWCPFKSVRNWKVGCVSITLPNNGTYCPGCFENKEGADPCNDDDDDFYEAITNELAQAFDVFKFNFIHDWINGSLYAFSFKLKDKPNGKSKFCNVDFFSKTNFIRSFDCGTNKYDDKTIFSQTEGVIKYVDGEYFYAPINRTSDWLYPTGIYNLGSMKSCDLLGKPKLVTDIPPTTFNLPEENFTIGDDIGVEPFLIDIGCLNTKSDRQQCTNQRRFCELGVSYDEDIGPHDELGNEDISDIPAFGPALLRGNLECLNVPEICDDCTNPPEGQFTDDWKKYRVGDGDPNSNLFTQYGEDKIVNLYRKEQIRNSFYFYFGIVPGKTAMDKLISQYFAPCERSEPCLIFISGSVTNNVCISGNTGSITANPKYGTPPYKYDWYVGIYRFGSINNQPYSLNGPNTIDNLYSGTYTVVVTDRVGNICQKSFSVLDPSPFVVNIDYSQYICPGANNGYIDVVPSGGIPPYSITWNNIPAINTYNTGNTIDSFYLTNLSPTSTCVNSGIGTFTPATTPSGFYFKATRPPGTSPAFTTTAPTKITSFPTIDANNSFQPGYGYGNNTSTPVSRANSVFIAQQTGTYSFRIFIERIITNFVGSNTGSFTVRIEIYSNVAAANSNASPGGGASQQTVTLSYNTSGGNNLVATNYTVNLLPVSMAAGQVAIVNFFLPNTLNAIRPDDVNGIITWEGIFGGTGTIFPNTTTNNQFYSFIVRDSAGSSCESFSALTVDITESCGITLTATSVGDNCASTATTKTSITAGVNGGVPPYVFTIQSSDTNYFWSGRTSNDEITRRGMPGKPCPGATYTINCVDSCGSSGTTSVIVVESGLRNLMFETYKIDGAYDDPRVYLDVYAGGADPSLISTTNTCVYSSPYWVAINANPINLGSLPETFWFYLPPAPPNTSPNTQTSYLSWRIPDNYSNENIKMTRTEIAGGLSRIDIIRGTGNLYPNPFIPVYWVPPTPSPTLSYTVCSSDYVYFHAIYLDDGGDCSNCKWSIKVLGCPEKLSNELKC